MLFKGLTSVFASHEGAIHKEVRNGVRFVRVFNCHFQIFNWKISSFQPPSHQTSIMRCWRHILALSMFDKRIRHGFNRCPIRQQDIHVASFVVIWMPFLTIHVGKRIIAQSKQNTRDSMPTSCRHHISSSTSSS